MVNRIYELLEEVQCAYLQLENQNGYFGMVNKFKHDCIAKINSIEDGGNCSMTKTEIVADSIITKILNTVHRPDLYAYGMPTIGGKKVNTNSNSKDND